MTLAYSTAKVRVWRVLSPNGCHLSAGSAWQSGRLLFKAGHQGSQVPQDASPLALANDAQGRQYVIWRAQHPRHQGLVIQPADSHYCYEAILNQEG